MPAVVGALQALTNTVAALSDVAAECVDATAARRDPVLKFVARVKAEGFEVANDWTLTDTREQPRTNTAAYADPATVDPTLFNKTKTPRSPVGSRAPQATYSTVPGHLELLDRYGIAWVVRRSSRPGHVLYDDEVQAVVALSAEIVDLCTWP